MRRIFTLLVILAFVLSFANCYKNAMFYCGFGGDFCGQSKTNDVYSTIETVILAFANTAPDGRAIIDDANFPAAVVAEWRKAGKSVVISVGGQNGNWGFVFANDNSITNFVNSLGDMVQKYKLDGVDLDIESYLATPRTVANMIIKLRQRLNQIGRKLIILSP